MYDNGVISFKQPGTEGALSPWQWDSRQLKDAMASYFIAALWADIAPTSGTTYTTKGDSSSMTYSWNNISQYYGGAPALNTFSTTIKADGSIATSYYSLGLNATNVSVGTVGDYSLGQYDQKYYAPFGTTVINGTIANWGGANQIDPCKENPLYSPTCPGYAAAYVTTIKPATSETTSTTTTPVEVIQAPQTTTVSATTSIAAPTNTSTVVTSTPIAQPISVAKTETVASKPSVSLSTILGIVSAEQSRLSNVEKSVVQESVSLATAASQTTRESAESTAANAAAAFTGNGITVASLQNGSSKSVSLGSSFSMSATDRLVVDFIPERLQEQTQQSQQNDSVKKNVQNNDLAKGVSITALATQPTNYSSYFTTLPDNQFYQPKEIYNKQSVVDNARALRQLSSDRLHRDLVDLQYNNKGN